jgi:hypothetical protein
MAFRQLTGSCLVKRLGKDGAVIDGSRRNSRFWRDPNVQRRRFA